MMILTPQNSFALFAPPVSIDSYLEIFKISSFKTAIILETIVKKIHKKLYFYGGHGHN